MVRKLFIDEAAREIIGECTRERGLSPTDWHYSVQSNTFGLVLSDEREVGIYMTGRYRKYDTVVVAGVVLREYKLENGRDVADVESIKDEATKKEVMAALRDPKIKLNGAIEPRSSWRFEFWTDG